MEKKIKTHELLATGRLAEILRRTLNVPAKT